MNWPLVWTIGEKFLELLAEMKDEPALDTYRTEKMIDDLSTEIAGYRATWAAVERHRVKCPTCRGTGVLVPGPGAEEPPENP